MTNVNLGTAEQYGTGKHRNETHNINWILSIFKTSSDEVAGPVNNREQGETGRLRREVHDTNKNENVLMVKIYLLRTVKVTGF